MKNMRWIGLMLLLLCQSSFGQLTRILPSQQPPTNSILAGDLMLVTKYPGTGSEKIYKMIFTDFFNWMVTSGLIDSNKLTTATNTLNAHIFTVENAATALATRTAILETFKALVWGGLQATNSAFWGSNSYGVFPQPHWDITSLTTGPTLYDGSNFIVLHTRHAGVNARGDDEGSYNNVVYFGGAGSLGPPGAPGVDALAFVMAGANSSIPSLARNPRATFIFNSDDQTWRIRPTNIVFDPFSTAQMQYDIGEMRLMGHDNKANTFVGNEIYTNNVTGEAINMEASTRVKLSTFGTHYFTVVTPADMTAKTISIVVNGVTYLKTNGVDYALSGGVNTIAYAMATDLNQTVPGIRAYNPDFFQAGSPVVLIKPLHSTTTLTLAQDSASGVTSYNDSGGRIDLVSGSINLSSVVRITNNALTIFNSSGTAFQKALADDGDGNLEVGGDWAQVRIGALGAGTVFNGNGLFTESATGDLGTSAGGFRNIYFTGTGAISNLTGAAITMGGGGPPSTAVNGSMHLSSTNGGTLYFRTNSTWLIK